MEIKKRKFILIGFIIILTAAAFFCIWKIKTGAVAVDMAIVERGSIKEYIEENAVVGLNEEVEVYAPLGGKVMSAMFEIGDEVKRGDILVKLDEQEYVSQIKGLELQKQAIAVKLEKAGKTLSEAELRKLDAQEKSAEIALDEAKRLADNNEKLYDAGAISKDTFESTLAALAVAEANHEMARSSIEIAQEGMSAQERELLNIQAREIQTQIDLLQARSSELIIKAPMEGIILEKDVKVGSVLQPGKRIFQIGNITDLFLESDILADEIKGVNVGSEVIIENKDMGIYGLEGAVGEIHPKAFGKVSELGIEQKRVRIRIDFKDSISSLKPGYEMDIKVVTAVAENTLLIDEKAIFEYHGKDYVFLNNSGLAEMRRIEKGLKSEDKVEVLEGLREGDEVILSPDEKIKDGMRIMSKGDVPNLSQIYGNLY
ncbi:MAG: efflux RND transporter periplasmic adaptor subunit [Alkaliphilus sp.]|nr:efflux RND transporter periplasmic adaptor subunit [Alkaliphilus sp.]